MFINQCIALHLLRVSSGSTSECCDPIVEHLWRLFEPQLHRAFDARLAANPEPQ